MTAMYSNPENVITFLMFIYRMGHRDHGDLQWCQRHSIKGCLLQA